MASHRSPAADSTNSHRYLPKSPFSFTPREKCGLGGRAGPSVVRLDRGSAVVRLRFHAGGPVRKRAAYGTRLGPRAGLMQSIRCFIIRCMRTTLDIDNDVLETAKEIARKEKRTTGAVISELARRGFYGGGRSIAEPQVAYGEKNGIPVLPPTGMLVTEESIRKIREEKGI